LNHASDGFFGAEKTESELVHQFLNA